MQYIYSFILFSRFNHSLWFIHSRNSSDKYDHLNLNLMSSHTFIHSFGSLICLFVCSFVRFIHSIWLVNSFYSFFCSFVYELIWLIQSLIHSFVHLFIRLVDSFFQIDFKGALQKDIIPFSFHSDPIFSFF